ncbi:hypothetical protein [Streptomyces sp. SGAir0957]
MSDDDEDLQPASRHLNIITDCDGQTWISAHEVVTLLRAIANTHRNLADDPDCDLHSAAAAIDYEADNIDFMAIAKTGR